MHVLKRSQVFLYLLFFGIGNVYANEQAANARKLLVEMGRAMDSLNYQGTIVLFRNGKLDTLKFSHSVNDGIEQERLLSLNSPLREVIRNSKEIKCIFQDSNEVIIDHRPTQRSFLMDLPEDFILAEKNYKFSLAEQQTIALIPARVVVIKPQDNFRYTRKIWVSDKHSLPLKLELMNSAGKVLEQVVFIEQQVIDSIPPVEINIDTSSNVQHVHQIEPMDFSKSDFVLTQVPAGFKEVFFARRSLSDPNKPIDHLLISDGFSSISVYLEKGSIKKQATHQSAGAVNSYFRMLKDYQLTVMGEVPAHTLKYIADGIHLRGQ